MPGDKTASRGRGGGPNKQRRGQRGAMRTAQTERNPDNADQAQASKDEAVKIDEESKDQDGTESEVCHICAESMDKKYWAVAECNHRTCHVCALRLRALYKKTECTFCKSPQPLVIVTSSVDRPFESFGPNDTPFKDEKLAISFESQEIMEESLILLRFNCPDINCDHIAVGWPELKHHTRSIHGGLLCDLCIRHKKIFAHEHTLYTPQQLGIHLPTARGFGSKFSHASSSKSDIDVHPMCEFCQESFYGDDEHFQHMRQRHEECFLCKAEGVRHQYFQNYGSLEKHFVSAHHPCPKPDCLAQKFVVFVSEMDLKAHMVESHGEGMSTKDLKDLRRIQADFAPAIDPGRGRGRAHRSGDRPSQQPPHSTDQQRDTPVGPFTSGSSDPPAQARRRQAFGGNLTGNGLDPTPSESVQRVPTPIQSVQRVPTPSQVDVDPLVLQRHEAYMARLATATNNNSSSITAIKSAIRAYRSSESSAKDLVDTFFTVFDQDFENTGKFLSSLVDLLDNEEKKEDLLSAWNAYKIEHQPQESFPLPFGTTGHTPSWGATAGGGTSSGRALQVKRSQANSGKRKVWDRVEQAATSSSAASLPGSRGTRPMPTFPALPSSSTGRMPPSNTTPWSRSAALAASSSQTPTSRPSSGPTARGRPADSAFPSLPPSNVARPPREFVSGQSSLRTILGPSSTSANAWSATSEEQNTTTETSGETEQAETERLARKKKAPKQTLFTLGSLR